MPAGPETQAGLRPRRHARGSEPVRSSEPVPHSYPSATATPATSATSEGTFSASAGVVRSGSRASTARRCASLVASSYGSGVAGTWRRSTGPVPRRA